MSDHTKVRPVIVTDGDRGTTITTVPLNPTEQEVTDAIKTAYNHGFSDARAYTGGPAPDLVAIEARHQPGNETWSVQSVREDVPDLIAEVRWLRQKLADLWGKDLAKPWRDACEAWIDVAAHRNPPASPELDRARHLRQLAKDFDEGIK